MKKQIISSITALVMAISLTTAGCGQKAAPAGSDPQKTDTQAESVSESSSAPGTSGGSSIQALEAVSPEMAEAVAGLLQRADASGNDPAQDLEKAYRFLLSETSYLGVGTPDFSDHWQEAYVLDMLDIQRGNCFSYASTFAAIAAALGYNPSIITGSALWGEEDMPEHSWVVIEDKVCDPLLEDRLDEGAGDLHFFMTDYETLKEDQSCTYTQADTWPAF